MKQILLAFTEAGYAEFLRATRLRAQLAETGLRPLESADILALGIMERIEAGEDAALIGTPEEAKQAEEA